MTSHSTVLTRECAFWKVLLIDEKHHSTGLGLLHTFDSPKVGSKEAIGMVVGVAAAEKAGIWGIADVGRGAAADIIMLMVWLVLHTAIQIWSMEEQFLNSIGPNFTVLISTSGWCLGIASDHFLWFPYRWQHHQGNPDWLIPMAFLAEPWGRNGKGKGEKKKRPADKDRDPWHRFIENIEIFQVALMAWLMALGFSIHLNKPPKTPFVLSTPSCCTKDWRGDGSSGKGFTDLKFQEPKKDPWQKNPQQEW